MRPIFEDTATAFALKTDSELERAYFLFKMIANEPLVRIGTAMTNFALKANLPVEGLIRATVFDHFCGGVNEDDCMPLIDTLYEKGVSAVLDYSVEGKKEETQFDFSLQKAMETLSFVKEKDAIPFAVFKPTSFGRIDIYEKVGNNENLSEAEKAEWERIVARYEAICKKAHDMNVGLLIDAEESWMQDAADNLILDMMRKYNKEKAVIFNTIQTYRWDRLDYVKKIHAIAKEEQFKIGIKIVRGAYMEKENDRAEEHGYPTPICGSKQATDDNFNTVVTYAVEALDDIAVFAGTHNEESTYALMELMKVKGIETTDSRIWFGQLYGMSDHISFNLSHQGYNIAKYLPYGPVKDVMPYLIRRAEENTSVAGQTNRELELLKKERKRRKI